MLFEDKSLLRRKNTRENITEQIESMNISAVIQTSYISYL